MAKAYRTHEYYQLRSMITDYFGCNQGLWNILKLETIRGIVCAEGFALGYLSSFITLQVHELPEYWIC